MRRPVVAAVIAEVTCLGGRAVLPSPRGRMHAVKDAWVYQLESSLHSTIADLEVVRPLAVWHCQCPSLLVQGAWQGQFRLLLCQRWCKHRLTIMTSF